MDQSQICFRGFILILGVLIMAGLIGCEAAVRAPNEMVSHSFYLVVDEGVNEVKDVRYIYGETGWRDVEHAGGFPIGGYSGYMKIPDFFEISWEAESGQHYFFRIPVHSKIHESIKDKTIKFVIMADHVEGYISTPLPNFNESLERFY